MTTADWSQIDCQAIVLPMSDISPDLFGGDLFGDELIDMYNSAEVIGSGSAGIDVSEIPTLLPSSSGAATPEKIPPTSASQDEHPGAQVAMTAAAMDDGLGAFRPSTSFNDFSQFLPPSSTVSVDETTSAPAVKTAEVGKKPDSTVSDEAVKKVSNNGGKKRGRTESAVGGSANKLIPGATVKANGTVDPPTAVANKPAASVEGPVAKKRASGQKIACAVSKTAITEVTGSSEGNSAVKQEQVTTHETAPWSKADKRTPDPLQVSSVRKVVTPRGAASSVAVVSPGPVKSVISAVVPSAVSALPVNKSNIIPTSHSIAVAPVPTTKSGAAPSKPTITAESVISGAVAATASTKSSPSTLAIPQQSVSPALAAVGAQAAASQFISCRGQTTEEDFKSVAQAAVTSLIMNANSGCSVAVNGSNGTHSDSETSSGYSSKIDTSTAHIAALTSSNWVAACSGMPSIIGSGSTADSGLSAASSLSVDSKANRARRANLTPDERARQNRDRNREHARNTRLRKKAYVEELKRTLTELVKQRDSAELERRHAAQRETEQREVRFRVMEEFLKLRGRNEPNVARWVAILDDGFTLTLPRTEYRHMVNEERPSFTPRQVSFGDVSGKTQAAASIGNVASVAPEQVLRSVTDIMADSAHLAHFVGALGNSSTALSSQIISVTPKKLPVVGNSTSGAAKQGVSIAYQCDRRRFLMDGCTGVLDWTASTVGAVKQGAPSELVFKGTMRSTFNPESNKLRSVEIMFDTGSIIAQVRGMRFARMTRSVSSGADMSDAVAAAAAAAASEADALLDSIQMPQLCLPSLVPAAVSVVHRHPATNAPSSASITASEKEESSSDESV